MHVRGQPVGTVNPDLACWLIPLQQYKVLDYKRRRVWPPPRPPAAAGADDTVVAALLLASATSYRGARPPVGVRAEKDRLAQAGGGLWSRRAAASSYLGALEGHRKPVVARLP